jgi:hypothetical protein
MAAKKKAVKKWKICARGRWQDQPPEKTTEAPWFIGSKLLGANTLALGVRGIFPAVCNGKKLATQFWAARRKATNRQGQLLSQQHPSMMSLTPTQPRKYR